MTNRDFDADDGRVLAEFCDLEKRTYVDQPGADYFLDGRFICYQRNWKPWDMRSPQLQIQLCKDAVREKGLEDQFEDKLLIELTGTKHPTEGVSIAKLASAPPEAICSAVLEIIPEGSGE